MENPKEKKILDELRQELEKLQKESPPRTEKQIGDELEAMERDLEEEDEFKKLEKQVELEERRKYLKNK